MAALTAAAIGLSALGVYSALKGGRQKMPAPPTIPPPPDPVKVTDPAIALARKKRRQALESAPRNTRSGTLLTGPSGLTNSAPVERKTLLGG